MLVLSIAPALVPVTSTGTSSATETTLVNITNSSAVSVFHGDKFHSAFLPRSALKLP